MCSAICAIRFFRFIDKNKQDPLIVEKKSFLIYVLGCVVLLQFIFNGQPRSWYTLHFGCIQTHGNWKHTLFSLNSVNCAIKLHFHFRKSAHCVRIDYFMPHWKITIYHRNQFINTQSMAFPYEQFHWWGANDSMIFFYFYFSLKLFWSLFTTQNSNFILWMRWNNALYTCAAVDVRSCRLSPLSSAAVL